MRELSEDAMNIHITQKEKDLLLFDAEGLEGYKNSVNVNKYDVIGMIKVGRKRLYMNVSI